VILDANVIPLKGGQLLSWFDAGTPHEVVVQIPMETQQDPTSTKIQGKATYEEVVSESLSDSRKA
jgi:hypothetical protein